MRFHWQTMAKHYIYYRTEFELRPLQYYGRVCIQFVMTDFVIVKFDNNAHAQLKTKTAYYIENH